MKSTSLLKNRSSDILSQEKRFFADAQSDSIGKAQKDSIGSA